MQLTKMVRPGLALFVASIFLSLGIGGVATTASAQTSAPFELRLRPQPERNTPFFRGGAAGPSSPATSPLNVVTYHGGAVLPTTTTYAIWWGKSSDFPSDELEAVDTFLGGLEGSDYLHIGDQYMLRGKAHTRFGGNLFDYSAPTPIDAQGTLNPLGQEVFNVLQAYGMTPDPSAVYIVYTSNYPPQLLLLYGACAIHGFETDNAGNPIFQVAWAPNVSTSLSVCGTNIIDNVDPLFSPDPDSEGTRAILSLSAHEFMETITDPHFDAWWAPTNGNEVGDSCAYVFATPVSLAKRNWRVQEIWSNEAGGCAPGTDLEGQVLGASSSFASLSTFDSTAATDLPPLDRSSG